MGGGIISQMYYCIKAAELLKPLGIMAIVVPASFLSDEYLDGAKISELKKDFSFLGQVSIQKDAFKALGVDNYATKILFWQKKLDVADEGKPYALNSATGLILPTWIMRRIFLRLSKQKLLPRPGRKCVAIALALSYHLWAKTPASLNMKFGR